jgi:pyrroloquinoline-quinone synthase
MNGSDLCEIVARYDLNKHPFYQAWLAGRLPRERLGAYAFDYAPFIEEVEVGWRTLGEGEHAETERKHTALWHRFRDGFPHDDAKECEASLALVREAQRSFRDPVSALGALFAFEAQQASISRAKLDGLRAHYGIDDDRADYFRVHADDYGERDWLLARMAHLASADQPHAAAACERLCVAMWSALDGILAGGRGAARRTMA